MSDVDPPSNTPSAAGDVSDRGRWLSQLPTGARVFLILGGALLPLALLAFLATIQTTRIADVEVRAQLRVALAESTRSISAELLGDMAALRTGVAALAADPGNDAICARAQGVFAQQYAAGLRFAINAPDGRLLCGTPLAPGLAFARDALEPGRIAAKVVKNGVALAIADPRGGVIGTAFFPAGFLAPIAQPSGLLADKGIALRDDAQSLTLADLPEAGLLARTESAATPIGIDGLVVEMTMRGAPITSPLLVAMLIPFLMWAGAAAIAWFVVDRLLIRPLRRLRASVGAYAPGTVLGPVDYGAVPAQEIRQLGETFRAITRTVVAHEAGLAEGLVRQTKLTREVHHRVKNNLQVIASLINFHARGAVTPEASAAYASIQRRVDALAVVHRYHFAELEENRGVEMRAVIGELAAGIRAGAPEGAHRFAVGIEVEPLTVSQDIAIAVAFLVTELLELAMTANPETQARISMRQSDDQPKMGVLRVVSPALIQGDTLDALLATRYGRVIAGLARQLRAPLHHDPLSGAYEINVALMARD
ncbi:histidine kinase [Sphingomonas spermidinifaciens]|uniref:histidine kinase n=1 Tax=Sphingomonas spermidinifaciens TaxID=1141889 RepID=A0A2A4B8J1_9SPHN|nr:histidine kinase dimerization/phosphoacceptor domain -containing protein [Sphingomonas spermidinifaciens]PCD03946.1 histidine kinase [Sphingomonas spermidinifaciens]